MGFVWQSDSCLISGLGLYEHLFAVLSRVELFTPLELEIPISILNEITFILSHLNSIAEFYAA